MGIVTISAYMCERCQHQWVPREKGRGTGMGPKICPKCKSPYWDRAYGNARLEIKAGVGMITMNRPNQRNALSRSMIRELHDALSKIEKDDEVNCLLIAGLKDCFCSGADLKELMSEAIVDFVRDTRGLVQRIADFNKPTIAAISGWCVAGGLEIALACDLRIASESALFGDGYIKIGGIGGAGGAARLPRLVGVAKAKEIIYTGEYISAIEAHRIGLVNGVYQVGEYLREATVLAETIAKMSPEAIQVSKKAVDVGMGMTLAEAIRYNDECNDSFLRRSDLAGKITSFLGKGSVAQE